MISSGIAIDWKGTDIFGDNSTYNPAFVKWVDASATPTEKCEGNMPAKMERLLEEGSECSVRKNVVISGIAAGGPGSWDKVFREGVLDERTKSCRAAI